MSISSTLCLKMGLFQQQEAKPIGKIKRSDFAPPGEAKWLLSQEQILGLQFTKEITVRKCHKPNLCVCEWKKEHVCVCYFKSASYFSRSKGSLL